MPEAEIRVLVVEDDLEQQKGLVEWLEGSVNAIVDATDTGEQALKLLEECKGNYDVVLMDQRLPGIDGITTMRRMKENFPVIPIIMFTEVAPEVGMDALRQGAYRYLSKPPNLEEVTLLVQHAGELRKAAQLQVQLKLSEMLRKASRDLGLANDVDTILQKTFEYAFHLVGDTTGMVLSVEQDQCLRIVDCRGVQPAQRDSFNNDQIKADKGSFGIVVRTGEIFESEDTGEDLKAGRILDFGLPVPAKVVNIPIKRGKAVAAILVLDTLPPSSEVRETVVALADIAGIALGNVSERATLTALYEVGQELTLSANLNQVLESIVKWTQIVLGADAVVLYEYDSVNDSLGLSPKFAGLHDVETVSQIGEYHNQIVAFCFIRAGKSFHYALDAKQDSFLNPQRSTGDPSTFVERENIESSGAILLHALGEIVGVLFFNYRIQHEFDEQERQKVQLFADQAAVAIQNIRRYEREQILRNQAETLREVSASISSETDIERVAEKILDNLKRVANYTTASIQLIHGDRRKLLASRGFDKDTTSGWLLRPVSEDRLVSRVVLRRKPYVLPDTSKSNLWDKSEETAAVKSWMGLPLIWGKDVIGILTLDHDTPGFYTDKLASLGMSFAQQTAVAIHNVRLVERLRVLNRVGHELSVEEKPDIMLDKVVRAVVETLECTHCTFFRLEGKDLVPRATCIPGGATSITRRFELGEGLVGLVAVQEESLLTRDAQAHRAFLVGQTRPHLQRSMILAPVLVEGAVFGVLSADQDRINSFNAEDLQMLETIAAQLAAAIQNVNLLSREQKRAETLSRLQQVTQAISEAVDLPDSLRLIVQNAVQLMEVNTGIIHLIDTSRLEVVTSYGYPSQTRNLPTRFSQKEGLTWQVYVSGAPVEVFDVPHDPWVSPGFAKSGVRSTIGIPLKLNGDVIGVLFLNSHTPRTFSDEEKRLLMTLAEQAALVTDRLRRYEQRVKDITVLEQINKAILEGQLDQILQLVATHSQTLTGADCATIRLIDESGQFLDLKAGEGYESKQERLPVDGTSFSGWVATTGKGALCPNVDEECEHYAAWRPEVKSCMAAPLKQEKQIVGTLYVESERERAFSQQYQLDLLQAMADQAALALHIGELYSQRGRDLSVLQEINEAVISENLDVILDLVVKKAVETMPGEYGELWLHDSVTDDLMLESVFGPESVMVIAKKGRRIKPGIPSINRRVFEEGILHVSANVETEGFYRIYEGAQSAVTVPLKYRGISIGTLNVESAKLNAFTPQHAQFLDTLSDQAAVAIKNAGLYQEQARLYQNLARYNHTLAKVLSQVSSGDLKKVLYAITERSVEVIGGEHSELWLIDSHSGDLVLRSVWGQHKPLDKMQQQIGKRRLRINSPSIGMRVVRDKLPYYICEDFEPETAPDPIYSEAKSSITVPLTRQEKIVGVLNIESKKRELFVKRDVDWLTDFANIAAIALENARLFEETRQALQCTRQALQRTQTLGNLGSGLADLEVNI